ncbi:SH3 domain-containing protein [Roseobacter sp.]|uniref:SH3 domain-containing protein n=1 Tax=Roseobacter sp. TaxID=1907202 RepID=UPI00385C2426
MWIFGGIGLFVWLVGQELPDADPATRQALTSEASKNNHAFDKPAAQNPAVLPSDSTNEKAALFVSGSRVNVRSGPGVSHGVMGQLNLGDKVMQVSVSGGWKQIETRFGIGWMSSNYLATSMPKPKTIEPPEPRKRQVAVPTSREIQAARNEIIQQSIRAYSGSCPCPYNRDRAGRQCGGRSAWSRPGGYSPICYDSDVSEARLNTYFARRRGVGN